MLQPKPKLNLDLSGYKKEEEVSPKLNLDLSGYRPEKKKESSVSTSTTAPSNAVLDGGTNSLATSTNIGFPEIDTNSVAPGMGEQPKIGDKTVKVKDEMGFGGASINRLDTSLASFSKSIYDAPKMLLDAIYSPQNYIAEKLNIPSLKVDPEVYAYENIPSKQMDKVMANNNAKIAKYKADIGGDVLTAFENGDYVNTFKHAALNSFESAPLIVATILTGGSSAVANSIMIGSSASTQYDTLNKENPEMGTPEKLGNAAVNGTLEVIVGKYMEGVGGNVWRSLLKNKGAKEGASIATNSFKKSLEKVVGKSPAVGVAFEYAEERITNGLQQLNDIATGVKTEFDWNENKSSGLSSLGFSLPNSTALYSSKAFISNKSRQKVKSSNKEIMNLQSELQNDNITPENKKLITASIDKIYNENRNLLGAELEKLSSIQEVHKKELVSIDKAMDDSKSQAIDIKHDNNISNESKASLLKTLGDEFKKNIQRKNEILTKTPFELLSGNEQAKRKTKAAREIMKKENPDGTKSITIDDAESKKLATEIFDKELADKKIAENQQEAQPKAEEQKASEADKVEQLRANEQVELKELLPNAELKSDGKIDVKKLSEEDAVVYGKVYDKYDKLITPLLEQSASPKVVAENVEGQGVSKEVVAPIIEKPISSQENNNLAAINTLNELDKIHTLKGDAYLNKSKERIEKQNSISKQNIEEFLKKGWRDESFVKSEVDKFNNEFSKQAANSNEEVKIPKIISIKLDSPENYPQSKFSQEYHKDKGLNWEVKFQDGNTYSIGTDNAMGNPYSAMMQSWLNEFHSINKSKEYANSVFGRKDILKPSDLYNYNPLQNNEKLPETNTSVNGNVQLGVEPVGESGITKPETINEEGVPSPVVVGESKNTTFKPKEETIKDEKGNPITFYHGSNNEFTDFNESMLGSFTGADSAKEGFFFTSNEGVANSYRQQSIYDSPNIEGLKKALNGLSKKEIAKLGTKLLPNRDEKFYYGDLTKQESIDDIVEDVIRDTEKDSYYPDRNKYIEKVSKIFEEKGIDLKPYLDKGQIVETNLDIKNPKIVDAKEEFAEDIELTKIIKDAKEQGHDGVIIKNTYDSISFDEKGNDTQLSDIVVVFDKSQINIKNKPTETPQTKLVEGDAEVSDLDNAKDQIAKGVLQWNGDSGAERVNLGITWADIRKGEADINRGKENTVPAKRLIEALKTAKEKGGYEYIQGKGGITNTQFVSLEDIQKLNNEYQLTDVEQKQVRENEFESARKYDEDFNSLSKNEQIEILENYENREDNSGTPVADSGQPQSKNDVPKAKEGEGAKPKPTTKERVAERVKLSDSKIDANSEIVKARLKAFTAMFPSADINPDDYKTNGFTMDAVIDMVAKAAKSIAKGGIVTSEHINEAIKGWNMHFDDVVDAEAVAEYINPKKEEETSSIDLESFRDSWNKEPSSGEINQYDSGNTIRREQGELRNNQDYEVQKDLARVQIGLQAIEQAKVLFGAQYIEKTLAFIEQANLGPEKKAVAYVLLENEMDARVKAFPNNVGAKKLQDLVRAKSQEFLANSARAIGAGRFRVERFRELAKKGFTESEFTNAILTTQQIKNKAKIEQISQVSIDDVNNEAEAQENQVVDENLERLISEGVEKQINEIYKKLPTNRRIKADKAIAALENIQKNLRNKAYDATIGVPVAIIDSGITIIKNSIKAGVNIADAIEMGINHIKLKHGKKWEKESGFRQDMRNGFEDEGVAIKEKTPKEKTENQKAKEDVKQALIDKGFFREITVKGVVKKYIDWKKLAGEAGSVENIRLNVEQALKEKGYSKSKIDKSRDALEKEYVRLTEDVIRKGLNELLNRNKERKPVNTKSAAKKLAELYNYGIFEKNKDSYENVFNRLLGINDLDQKAFDGMKEIANGYTTLMNSEFTEIAMKGAINELSRRQARLLGNYSFVRGTKGFKIMTALQEITSLSTRFKLVNLGNLAENISSGIMARAYNDITDIYLAKVKGEKRTTKELRLQTSKNARAKLKGIVFEASESYGDTSSMLLDHSMIEDRINESTSNKYVHALLSSYMGRPVLEGADSFNKILLTEAKIRNAASRILMKKGLNKRESLDYISKALTGESMDDAKLKAKTLIDQVNTKAGKKILNNSQVSIESLASDIVKDALVSGGQMTVKELEAVYNSAYKSAGRDIGHVSNNSFTDMISANNAKIEKKVADAIQEKNWRNAAYFTGQKMIFRNFIYTFAGGGTNWFIKGLQKAGNPLSYISLYDDVRLRAGKELDITTDEGIKNMEKVLYRDMNIRSTAGTIMIGTLNALLMFSALKASGGDDDINEWLKENLWAKKFFDKMAPDVVVAMLAWENKEMGRYFSKMINQKPDFFDDQKNIAIALDSYAEGIIENDKRKTDKATGIVGTIIGSRFDVPGPLKLGKNVKKIYKGAIKGEEVKTDYYASGFWNGFLRGGIAEAWDLRPDPSSPKNETTEEKFIKSQAKKEILYKLSPDEKNKIRMDDKLKRPESKVNRVKELRMAKKMNLPYYISKDASISAEKVAKLNLADEAVINAIMLRIDQKREEYGIVDEEE
jgi:hypothetical protein